MTIPGWDRHGLERLARCWALLLVRILAHIGEPTQPPQVLPARSPPQETRPFDQTPACGDWPDMDQSAGLGDGWE